MLTKKEVDLLFFMRKFRKKHKVNATFRELAHNFDVSTSAISQMLKRLKGRGFVKKNGYLQRAYYVNNNKLSALTKHYDIPR